MKTDKELLELAAKAAGWKIAEWMLFNGIEVALLDDGMTYWQPLIPNSATDCDGDALRLAVKLHISFALLYWPLSQKVTANVEGVNRSVEEDMSEDHCAATRRATRRAIVRAAAAIEWGAELRAKETAEIERE